MISGTTLLSATAVSRQMPGDSCRNVRTYRRATTRFREYYERFLAVNAFACLRVAVRRSRHHDQAGATVNLFFRADDLDAVVESDTCNPLGQLICALSRRQVEMPRRYSTGNSASRLRVRRAHSGRF